jgi:hypothetical protein
MTMIPFYSAHPPMNQDLTIVTIGGDNFGSGPRRHHHSPLGDDDAGGPTKKEMKENVDESRSPGNGDYRC